MVVDIHGNVAREHSNVVSVDLLRRATAFLGARKRIFRHEKVIFSITVINIVFENEIGALIGTEDILLFLLKKFFT